VIGGVLLIEAGLLRNKKVTSSDGKNIGIIQNVLFEADPVNPLAYILVFLKEPNWLKKYVTENWGQIGIKTITALIPDQASEIYSDLKEKGEEETLKFWRAYLKNKSEKDLSSLKCYLFPSDFLDESSCNEKDVKLKIEEKDLQDFLSIDIPETAKSSENMFAFYANSLERQPDCLIPVTLNKTPLHLKTLKDNLHNKGLISDLQLDLSRGAVANLVVNVMGQNAGKHFVPLDEINFDTQTLVDSKSFAVCPLVA
jgi:sporulation protein YlmC with PRC-barrel domain